MNRERVLVEITKLRPEWPTHSIIAILDHQKTADAVADPRFRSADLAEYIVRAWDAVAAKRLF